MAQADDGGGILAAALSAASRGWYVFPVAERGKTPTVRWREWSTTAVDVIAAEWSGRSLNVGIDCGKSGLIVVDEDTLGEFQRLADDLGHVIPDTYTVKTGRAGGGRQSYFTNHTGVRSTDLRKRGYNIDVKGVGGYVVAAGSGHPSGATYQAENTLRPAAFPTWLVDYLDGNSGPFTDPDQPFELPDVIKAGERDQVLFQYACQLRAQGTKVVAAARLIRAAHSRCEQTAGNPFTVEQALAKIDQAWGYNGGTDANDKTPNRLGVRLLTRSELGSLPEPAPLIGDTLDRRTVALLAGYWGTLKSFIALDWALSVATGHHWQGRDTVTGPTIYIAAEGAYGIHKRVDTWEYAWRKGELTPDDMFRVWPAPLNLTHPEEVRELCAWADGMALIVIDTVNRCAVGGDENSARDMGMFVDALYRVREATTDGTVLALHHTGKDKTTIRGSSALEAGVDTVYQTEGDHTAITLKRTKRKDGPPGDVLQLRLETVLESGVVSQNRVGIAPSGTDLLSHFDSHFSRTGATRRQLREVVPDMPDSTFYRSLNALVTAGSLRNDGTSQRPFYRLAGEEP